MTFDPKELSTSKYIQGVISKLDLKEIDEPGWMCSMPFCLIVNKGEDVPKFCPKCSTRDPIKITGKSLYSLDMKELIRWKPDEEAIKQALLKEWKKGLEERIKK